MAADAPVRVMVDAPLRATAADVPHPATAGVIRRRAATVAVVDRTAAAVDRTAAVAAADMGGNIALDFSPA